MFPWKDLGLSFRRIGSLLLQPSWMDEYEGERGMQQ